MISFKGYDAAPLKTLYMQSLEPEGQKEAFRQLRTIGEKENFNVLAQHNDKLCRNTTEARGRIDYNKWGQDNKIIVNKNGKRIVVGPKIAELYAQFAYKNFSKLTGIEKEDSETFFEGGNVFLGKKENGENYALMGIETLDENCAILFLKDKKKKATLDLVMALSENVANFKYARLIKEFNFKCCEYENMALENLSQTLNVKKENIFLVPQNNFHIDMMLRPLGYPYVLVNNPKLAIENLQNLQEKFPEKDYNDLILSTKYSSTELKLLGYEDSDEVVSELKKQGFIPIEIGGIYGTRGEINFLNAIVNKHSSGAISYITNSAQPDDELEKLFEAQLKEKFENIQDIYFISGKENHKNSQKPSVRYNLQHQNGGLHCMVCEEPDFDIWG